MQAVNEGAFYYIQKPFVNDELVAILRRAAEHRQLRVENKTLKQEIRRRDRTAPARPMGKSKAWLDVLRLAETVAPTESTVLIQGESGTGKEVIARYIHDLSQRAERAVPLHQLRRAAREPARERAVRAREGIVHRRGEGQAGLFAAAARGTLLPRRDRRDDAGHAGEAAARAPAARGDPGGRHRGDADRHAHHRRHQPRPRGGDKRGNFRSDLFYRLNVIALHLPPLRQRRDDIPLLVDSFLQPRRGAARRGAEGAGRRGARGGAWSTTGPATCASWRTRSSAR